MDVLAVEAEDDRRQVRAVAEVVEVADAGEVAVRGVDADSAVTSGSSSSVTYGP
nr:hypothetical protein [Halogranum amylolyticum]